MKSVAFFTIEIIYIIWENTGTLQTSVRPRNDAFLFVDFRNFDICRRNFTDWSGLESLIRFDLKVFGRIGSEKEDFNTFSTPPWDVDRFSVANMDDRHRGLTQSDIEASKIFRFFLATCKLFGVNTKLTNRTARFGEILDEPWAKRV